MTADHRATLKELKIADIKVGSRHRKDMGSLTSLADSIRQEGLLQPIGVTDKLELVFGERRLRAHKDILKKKTILARIVDVPSILRGSIPGFRLSRPWVLIPRPSVPTSIATTSRL